MHIYYSQFGEDKILFETFHAKNFGVCVEVGANNGIEDSNTFFFEKLGWKCILVEPNPFLCKKIRQERKSLLYECAASNQCKTKTLYVVEGAKRSDGMSTVSTEKEVHDRIKLHGFVSKPVEVQTMTLDKILMDAQINCAIDFISIDVEGHEYEVLEGFSLKKWKPLIILIEDNSEFESNTVNKYLINYGYVRFMRTGVNDWYTHKSNKHLANIRNITRVKWMSIKTRLKNRYYLSFKMRIKNRLSKIPLIVTFYKYLRTK